ncbi:single-stranded DNA-binding protein [Kitasatospora purpeofusca]|uniref:single-stranded DNA-binding protein n=1 Tax=Kitasatospora purpeofusca TaxID=67352 RepID=UPI0038648759|nr:single-stranded DNA-binding protein [Kitasatospora purpeofusca]
MNGTQVTVIGNVATEVAYTLTPGGVPVANFRLASTERRFDRARELWVDGETQWLTVTAWRSLAGHLIDSLTKGDPVVVSGRLRVREWAEGEAKRSRVEIDARSVGHDLSRGTARFSWAPGGRAGVPEEGGGGAGAAFGEAVPGWIVDALRGRRAVDGGDGSATEGESGGDA